MEPKRITSNTKLGDVPALFQGKFRMEGETDEEFKARRKRENKLMKQRLKMGVSHYQSKNREPYKNPDRKVKKAVRARKKLIRKQQ